MTAAVPQRGEEIKRRLTVQLRKVPKVRFGRRKEGLKEKIISRSKTTTAAAPGIRMKGHKSRNVP
jgi:hypothetical protein